MIRQATEVFSLRTVPPSRAQTETNTAHTTSLHQGTEFETRHSPHSPHVSPSLVSSSPLNSFLPPSKFPPRTIILLILLCRHVATSHGDHQADSAGLPGIHAARGAKKLPFRPRDLRSKQNIRRYCHSDTDAQGVE